MCVLIFFTVYVENVSHSKKNFAKYDHKCIFVPIYNSCYSCPILKKNEFSQQIFDKYTNIDFHEHRSLAAELFHVDRWTDGQT